jgi:hypothetical protein
MYYFLLHEQIDIFINDYAFIYNKNCETLSFTN